MITQRMTPKCDHFIFNTLLLVLFTYKHYTPYFTHITRTYCFSVVKRVQTSCNPSRDSSKLPENRKNVGSCGGGAAAAATRAITITTNITSQQQQPPPPSLKTTPTLLIPPKTPPPNAVPLLLQ